MFRRDIKGIFVLSLLALLTGFIVNSFSPGGIEWIGSRGKEKSVVSAMAKNEQPSHAVEINNPFQMKEMVDAGKYLVLDVRHREIFEQGHIPGAISMPLIDYDKIIIQFKKANVLDTKLIVYCSSWECSDSLSFARRLEDSGYTNLQVFSGGMMEWEEQGFRVEYE